MKMIFECETELGRCDVDKVNDRFAQGPGDWIAFAHTTAAMTGSRGIVRIEQRCYLRSSEIQDEVRPQSWVKPEMALEPVLSSTGETTRMVRQRHERFIQMARDTFFEHSVLTANNSYCSV